MKRKEYQNVKVQFQKVFAIGFLFWKIQAFLLCRRLRTHLHNGNSSRGPEMTVRVAGTIRGACLQRYAEISTRKHGCALPSWGTGAGAPLHSAHVMELIKCKDKGHSAHTDGSPPWSPQLSSLWEWPAAPRRWTLASHPHAEQDKLSAGKNKRSV